MRTTLLGRTTFAALIFTTTSSLAAQDAQSRLWDGAIAGDTITIGKALAEGAKIDSLDTRTATNGRRALNWAALHNRVDAIRFLLARGAPINAPNLTGFTPIAHAAEAGSYEAAVTLVGAGADINAVTRSGFRAIDIARELGHSSVVTLLEQAEKAKKP